MWSRRNSAARMVCVPGFAITGCCDRRAVRNRRRANSAPLCQTTCRARRNRLLAHRMRLLLRGFDREDGFGAVEQQALGGAAQSSFPTGVRWRMPMTSSSASSAAIASSRTSVTSSPTLWRISCWTPLAVSAVVDRRDLLSSGEARIHPRVALGGIDHQHLGVAQFCLGEAVLERGTAVDVGAVSDDDHAFSFWSLRGLRSWASRSFSIISCTVASGRRYRMNCTIAGTASSNVMKM